MTKPTETYDQFDVIKVPFPFVDKTREKRRPALVLSRARVFNDKVECSICAMITTKAEVAWPGDTHISDLDAAGLPFPSIVRFKLFTLDHRLVLARLGHLGRADCAGVKKAMQRLLIGSSR